MITANTPTQTNPNPPGNPGLARRIEAYRLCAAPRPPQAEFTPADLPFLEAWQNARYAAAAERSQALSIIDTFLMEYGAELRDLALRAQEGRAPAPVLDEIASVLCAIV